MAENKKSFILYCDQKGVWDKLDDAQAGKLIKHIISYVNDENPIAPDFITELAFEPIKQQLKRDLSKWAEIKVERSESGRLGGIKSGEARREKKQTEANEASASNPKQTEANEAVNVNVNVNANVNDTNKDIMSPSGDQKKTTPPSLTERIDEFSKEVMIVGSSTYTDQMLTRFIKYWTEPSRAKKPKLKFEKESTWDTAGRLAYWARTNYDKIPCYLAEDVPISVKKAQFVKSLAEYQDKYSKDMLNEFYRHWMQPENKSNPKMLRWELEEFWDIGARLKSWYERKNGFNKTEKPAEAYHIPPDRN